MPGRFGAVFERQDARRYLRQPRHEGPLGQNNLRPRVVEHQGEPRRREGRVERDIGAPAFRIANIPAIISNERSTARATMSPRPTPAARRWPAMRSAAAARSRYSSCARRTRPRWRRDSAPPAPRTVPGQRGVGIVLLRGGIELRPAPDAAPPRPSTGGRRAGDPGRRPPPRAKACQCPTRRAHGRRVEQFGAVGARPAIRPRRSCRLIEMSDFDVAGAADRSIRPASPAAAAASAVGVERQHRLDQREVAGSSRCGLGLATSCRRAPRRRPSAAIEHRGP